MRAKTVIPAAAQRRAGIHRPKDFLDSRFRAGLSGEPGPVARQRSCATKEDPHGRTWSTAVRFSISPQPGTDAACHRHNQSSPWPDLLRPPTSSKKTVWIAGKAWMTGTSPVKGTWSCSRVRTNNRFLSTGQPWCRSLIFPAVDDFFGILLGGCNLFAARTLGRLQNASGFGTQRAGPREPKRVIDRASGAARCWGRSS
jgi:hypothetical protein